MGIWIRSADRLSVIYVDAIAYKRDGLIGYTGTVNAHLGACKEEDAIAIIDEVFNAIKNRSIFFDMSLKVIKK